MGTGESLLPWDVAGMFSTLVQDMCPAHQEQIEGPDGIDVFVRRVIKSIIAPEQAECKNRACFVTSVAWTWKSMPGITSSS
jgi:hypothetical protein